MKDTALLFAELQDLKRLRPAGVRHSLADELFVSAWRAVLSGADWSVTADRTAARAVLYVLFPGVDARFFRAGMEASAIREVCRAAFTRTAAKRLDDATLDRLHPALEVVIEELAETRVSSISAPTELPDCLERLRQTPGPEPPTPNTRAWCSCPPRATPTTACSPPMYAALTAARYGPTRAGLRRLAPPPPQRLPARLRLGWRTGPRTHLARVIGNCRATALEEFPTDLSAQLADVLRHHESLATPEGYAISAGDVIDRVLDVKWRVRAAAVTETQVLGDRDLVHPGPLKDFQTALLAKSELWTTP